jgi:hypothetical protein
MLAGLSAGVQITIVQGLELLALALLAADAWGMREKAPILGSTDRAVAAGGWALLLLAAISLALALPAL